MTSKQHTSQFMLLALIFLTCELQSVSCVSYYVLTSSTGTCPEEFAWEQCLTLQRFASSFSQSQNVLLILEPGIHSLTTEITLSNMQNFTMVPAVANSKPRITCNTGSTSTQDIQLTAVSYVQIQGISFDGCTPTLGTSTFGIIGNSVLISDVLFTRSELTIRNIVDSVQLIRVNFTDCTLSHIKTFIDSTRIQMSHVIITRLNGIETRQAAEITVMDSIVQDITDSSFLLVKSPNVSVIRCQFMNNDVGNNKLGGGLYLESVTAMVNESLFLNNRALKGSGIGARSSNLTVDNSNFTINYAIDFGSIDSEGNNLTVTNSVFVSNRAAYGAGVAAIAMDSLLITNCSFSGNNKQAIFTRLGDDIAIMANTFSRNVGGGVFGGGAIASDRTLKLPITDCLFDSNTASDGKGGAIYMNDGGLLTLIRCNFIGNSAFLEGGAVYATGSLTARWTNFTNNVATNSGGAVNIYSFTGYKSISMSYCNLTGNRAEMATGGAMHVDSEYTAVNIDNSHFARNTARFGSGGAIHQEGQFTNISLVDSTFDSNSATSCGVVDIDNIQHRRVDFFRSTFTSNRATGTGTTDGGGVLCVSIASISLTDCTFNDNFAQHGGVLNVDDSNINMDRCYFIRNTANRMGGVAYTNVNPATYSVRLSIFSENLALGDGGALYLGIVRSQVNIVRSSFGSNSAGNRGGMVAINGSQLVIDNQTNIFDNTADMGPAISACNSELVTSSELTLTETDNGCKFYTANINSFNISGFIHQELSITTVTEIITTSPITTASPTTQETAVTMHVPHTNHSTPPTTSRETEEPSENTSPSSRPSDRPTPSIGTVNIIEPSSDPSTHFGKMALVISIVSLVLTLSLFVLVGVYLVIKMIIMLTRHRGLPTSRGSDTELLMEVKT